jgi:hypothetical protein
VFRSQDSPGYTLGFIIVVITSIVASLLGLLYRFVCIMENKKRDEMGVMEGFDDAFNDDSTDKKVCYNRFLFPKELSTCLRYSKFKALLTKLL